MTTIVKDTYTLMLGDCLERMREIPDGSVDLVLTSPPYDNLRTYNDSLMWTFDIFKAAASEIVRVLKDGGVCVWVVGDATLDGSETGTSFRQALHFKEMGLRLHDTMIWSKGGFSAVGALQTRYAPVFEYMFVFSKGPLRAFNPIKDSKNKHAGGTVHGTVRNADGSVVPVSGGNKKLIAEYGQRFNIWEIPPQRQRGKDKHPAPFPLALAKDHILSWSNPGDVVLDPFLGSGTSGEASITTGRQFIGIEKQPAYFEMSAERLSLAQSSGTTSGSTQSPADPDDSEPSLRGAYDGEGSRETS